MIKIIFDKENSDFSSLIITINQTPVDYFIDSNIIEIDDSLNFGLHELKLSIKGTKIAIVEVNINGSSLRQGLYFSFLQDGNNVCQPATSIWNENQVWVLRFGTPVSNWIGLLNEKLPKGALGTNLLDKFDIYWPESIKLDSSYPAVIKDYFEFNFNFTVLDKKDRSKLSLPYTKLDISVPNNVVNEILDNIDYLKANENPPTQQYYNSVDDPNLNLSTSWLITYLYKNNTSLLDKDHLIKTYTFIESLGLDIFYAFIGVLNSRQYATPHVDSESLTSSNAGYRGCAQLYIPIEWPEGRCYFKFANYGLLPTYPTVINNLFVHGLVNDTDRPRTILAIGCDILKVRDKFNLDLVD